MGFLDATIVMRRMHVLLRWWLGAFYGDLGVAVEIFVEGRLE